jgi:hypothetical protein
MTVEQYTEKLDGVAAMVNVLGQTDKVGQTDTNGDAGMATGCSTCPESLLVSRVAAHRMH